MEDRARKACRLKGYDYSKNGAYFVTICAKDKQMLFGNVGNGGHYPDDSPHSANNVPHRSNGSSPYVGDGLDRPEIQLTQRGKIARDELLKIPSHFAQVMINKMVIMPNHIHAIILIGCDGETGRSKPSPTLSTVIGLYKSGVSKRVHETEPDAILFQRSFHDHIIRNEADYLKIWQYIDTNPLRWEKDCFFTE